MELASSIDTFLQSHATNAEYVMLGKLGIVRAIAIEESNSLLAPRRDQNKPFAMKPLTDSWYVSLARQLFTGVPVETPERAFENVSFIVFNYDRCLQFFLIHALQVYFRVSAERAAEIVAQVRVLHPYGSLGSVLPGEDYLEFASEHVDLLSAADRIKTFSESAASDVIATAKDWVESSRTLIFLGFAFHEQNMELLEVDPNSKLMFRFQSEARAYATTFRLSESDERVVADQISYVRTGRPYNFDQPWIHTNNGTCAELFQSYWRSLTR